MNNPLVQPDPGLFIWTILTFLVLLGLLAKFAWKPLLKALESRQEAIKKSLDDADRAKQELARLQTESTKIIEQARIEADSILTKTRSDAERLREDLKTKAKEESDTIIRNAEQQIQLRTRQALQDIRQEVADIAVIVASKLLERNLAKEDNDRLINEAHARRLTELGLEGVQIGIYSNRPDIHDAITLVPAVSSMRGSVFLYPGSRPARGFWPELPSSFRKTGSRPAHLVTHRVTEHAET